MSLQPAPSVSSRRDDPELGPEKRCTVCGDWWPLDEEFWYFREFPAGKVERSRGYTYTRRTTVRHAYSRCRACWADRNRQNHAARRGVAA